LNILALSFTLFCFISTPILVTNNSKANVSRYIWILYFTNECIRNIVVFINVLSNTIDVLVSIQTPLLFIVGSALLGGLLILILHILFPEAVLFSHEQIIRAHKMYKLIPINSLIPRIGIRTINNYLETAKKFMTEEEITSSSLTE
jgi:hypothetical protein